MHKHEFQKQLYSPEVPSQEELLALIQYRTSYPRRRSEIGNDSLPAQMINPEVRAIVPRIIKTGAEIIDLTSRLESGQPAHSVGDEPVERVA